MLSLFDVFVFLCAVGVLACCCYFARRLSCSGVLCVLCVSCVIVALCAVFR